MHVGHSPMVGRSCATARKLHGRRKPAGESGGVLQAPPPEMPRVQAPILPPMSSPQPSWKAEVVETKESKPGEEGKKE